MLELGVIADDLTGGVKVASLLEAAGVRCPLVTSVAALHALSDDVPAVVVGRKLLSQPANQAVADARQSAEALLAKGAKQLYYKYSALFSSTARGNIGPVAEALTKVTGAEHVLFCPARPDRNATVYQGRLFLGRQLLSETPRRHDPVTPMTNANLVEVLQSQSRLDVGLLDHRTMRAGKAACERYLAEEGARGVRFFIVDVVDAGDLAQVAALARNMRLVTGSDDLPVALARQWPVPRSNPEPSSVPTPQPGAVAVLAGSCTPKTARQLARFEARHPVYRIDLVDAAGDAGLIDRVSDWAHGRLANTALAVATTADAEGVRRAQAELGRDGASALAEGILGSTARRLSALGVDRFVIAGGETSGAVMSALGVDRVDVAAYDELEGGLCQTVGKDPLSLVLKAGSAGQDDFMTHAVARLQGAATALPGADQ